MTKSQSIRSYIQQRVDALQVGECLRIGRREFDTAFCNWGYPSHNESPEDDFLSKQVGAAWGRIRVSRDPEFGDVTIFKHEEGVNRYSVDADRRHLYERGPDGFLHRKDL